MSRSSSIFGDPLMGPNPSSLKFQKPSMTIIHSIAKDDDSIQRKCRPLTLIPSNDKQHRKPTVNVSKEENLVIPQPTKPVFYLFSDHQYQSMDYPGLFMLAIVIGITLFACPTALLLTGSQTTVTIHHVFYSGWITAVATGVGVLPFFFLREPSKFYSGLSNAIAAGMMIAASVSLINEALEYKCEHADLLDYVTVLDREYHTCFRTTMGVALGLSFIFCTKLFLDEHEDLSIETLVGLDSEPDDISTEVDEQYKLERKIELQQSTQKMLLIIIVMTLHSLSEGIGIGVSYGGHRGMKLGQFISLSLAVHNVPEGLAVGLVMRARNVSTLRTVLWAMFTSIPQPIFAVPAFLFVERFAPMLPIGLGFAAGAMSYVAVFELFGEAMEDLHSSTLAAVIALCSFAGMMYVQEMVKEVQML